MDRFFGIPISTYRRVAREWGPFGVVLLFFYLSGAAGLVYQVVWTRKLVLLFGTTAYAVSTVLSVFFLGLGIGSFWGGRIADRCANPLRIYGVFEILIGVWAVLFIVGIDRGEFIVAQALQTFATSRAGGVALRALLAAAFLIVPVTLMGATLPLLSKMIGRSDRTRGLRIGLLYVINTAGAVSGCVFAGIYGIELYGYAKTTYIAAAANIGIGIFALIACGWFAYEKEDATFEQRTSGTPAAKAISIVAIAFAVSGFCTLALEVMWTRVLTLVFMGTTYAYTAMLASILVGIALGSLIAAALADRMKSPVFALGLVECAAGIACAATLIFIERLPETVQRFQHEYSLQFEGQMRVLFASSFTVLLVPTVFIGMTFPFAVRAVAASHARLGKDIGRLYGLNTFGGVLGAIAGGYILLPTLGAHTGIAVLGAVLIAIGIVLACTSAVRTIPKVALLVLVICVGGVVVSKLPRDVSESLNRSYLPPEHRVVAFREGVEGTVVVSEPVGNTGNSNRALWINGVQATQSILKGVRMNRFQGVLPFVFDREPKTALLICFGSGITAGTLATSHLSVTGVELSHDVLEMAHLFEDDNWHALANPNLRMHVDDGRNFLLTHEGRYDVITFEPMPLAVAGVSTFYSEEFYELCKMRLAPNGIVVQWVPLHATNLEVVRTAMRTFHEVFPYCTAWFVNADLFVAGSENPLRIDIGNAVRRMSEPQIADGMGEVGFVDATDMLSSYFMSGEAIATFAGDAPVMSDDRPWVEFLVPRILHQNTVGDSLRALIPHFESPFAIADEQTLQSAGAELRERLERRHRARAITIEGIETVYAVGPIGNPERIFEEALDIDPTDILARSYYSEIAPQRFAQFVRYKEYEEAEAYLDRFARYVPESGEVWAYRVELYTAWGKAQEAAEARRKLDELSARGAS
ncbi:MAG: fused MFS/spermidine synthase [Candidatus Hydrogenedentes bacterium]|nr:fused MFS/spermidine synthase [Candidatus Hydrogenedentota bacterium]